MGRLRSLMALLALLLPLSACTPKYTGASDVYDQPWSHGLVTGFMGITDLKDAEPWNPESGRPRPEPVDADDHARIISAKSLILIS